jgi:hypothetical protein
MSENTTIYKRIIDFQKSMPTIKKDGTNPYFNKKYAPLDTIQKAIQESLANAGLGYTQEATTEGLKTTLFDVDGNSKEFMYPAIFQGKPQDIGSAMTYAKRYALTACLGLIIEGEDDDGNSAQNSDKQNYKAKEKQPENIVWLTQEQFEKLKQLIQSGENREGVLGTIKKFSGATLEGVTYKMKKAYSDELNTLIK